MYLMDKCAAYFADKFVVKEMDDNLMERAIRGVAKNHPEFLDVLKAMTIGDLRRYYRAENQTIRDRIKGERVRTFFILKALEDAQKTGIKSEPKEKPNLKRFLSRGRYGI